MGASQKRLKRGEVDINDAVISGILVACKGYVIGFSALGFEVKDTKDGFAWSLNK